MIDTVSFQQDHELYSQLPRGIVTLDKSSDLRAYSDGYGNLIWFEVSLPKVLFGNNGELIKSQSQINKALIKVDKLISEWASPSEAKKKFTRVDLVWQFRASPAKYFSAHEQANHPEIHRKISVYRNIHRCTGIDWQGANMKIRMYDKTDRKLKLPLPLVRVEVELHSFKLRRKFNQDPLTKLDFDTCYKVYRAVVIQFQPKGVPRIRGKDEVLCLAHLKGIKVLQHLAGTMHPKSITRLRKKITYFTLDDYNIDWNTKLPLNNPPRAYDVGLKPPVRIGGHKPMRIKSSSTM